MASRTTPPVPLAAGALAVALLAGCTDGTGPEEIDCEVPSIPVASWVPANGPGVRFLLPPGFQAGPEDDWQFGRAWIRFDVVSPGERPTTPEWQLHGYRSCDAEIDGKAVLLENGAVVAEPGVGDGFYVAATWRFVTLGALSTPVHLVMSGFAPDRDVIMNVFRAIWTVEFTFTGPS